MMMPKYNKIHNFKDFLMNEEEDLFDYKFGVSHDKERGEIEYITDIDTNSHQISDSILEDLNNYLEMSKSSENTEIYEAVEWINKMFHFVFTYCPKDFILVLADFCKSDMNELVIESFDLLLRFMHSSRKNEFLDDLLNNNLIELIQSHFPNNQTIDMLSPVSTSDIGRKLLLESDLLATIDSFFTDELEPESVGLIAQFIANLTKYPFTYENQIDNVCNIVLKFGNYIKKEIDPIISSNITRAFCSFVNSSDNFADFFINNFELPIFFIYDGLPVAGEEENEEISNARYASISDVIVMIHDLLCYKEDYCMYALDNELLDYIEDVFYYPDDYLNTVIIELLSNVMSIVPEIIRQYHTNSYESMLSSQLYDTNISVARRIATVNFISTFLISGMSVEKSFLYEIQGGIPDGGLFMALVRNIEVITNIDDINLALDALLKIREFEWTEEIDQILTAMNEDDTFRGWLDDVQSQEEKENDANFKARIMEDLLKSIEIDE